MYIAWHVRTYVFVYTYILKPDTCVCACVLVYINYTTLNHEESRVYCFCYRRCCGTRVCVRFFVNLRVRLSFQFGDERSVLSLVDMDGTRYVLYARHTARSVGSCSCSQVIRSGADRIEWKSVVRMCFYVIFVHKRETRPTRYIGCIDRTQRS